MSNERIRNLRARALHARRLADNVSGDIAAANLRRYANDLERQARDLETAMGLQPPVVSSLRVQSHSM